MIVAIYATEGIYGGLHGISDSQVIVVDTIEEAEKFARDLSYQVMIDYGVFDEFAESAAEEGLKPDTEEYEQYIEYCADENIEYRIWEVINPYDTLGIMENDFYNDRNSFVNEHCRELRTVDT